MSKFEIHGARAVFSAIVLVATPIFAVACWDNDPCDPGKVLHNNLCYDPDPVPQPKPEGGVSDGGGDGASTELVDTFGKSCTDSADCAGGNAPICGAPQLPMCIQINCAAGEANEGVCPSGWQCIKVPPNPSACVKL